MPSPGMICDPSSDPVIIDEYACIRCNPQPAVRAVGKVTAEIRCRSVLCRTIQCSEAFCVRVEKIESGTLGCCPYPVPVPVLEYELVTKKLNVTVPVIRALEEQKVLAVESEQVYRNPVKLSGKKADEINTAINQEINRGSTLIHTATGYLKQEQDMIMTVISNRELARLNRVVMKIDPDAFMIVAKVNEVSGKGFSRPRKSEA